MAARAFAVGTVLAALSCMSTQHVQPAQFIPEHRPDAILIWTKDSDVTSVAQPRIDGDTLRGTVTGLQERVAIPLQSIVRAEARAPDPTKTAILATGGVGVAGLVAYLITKSHSSTSTQPTCPFPDPEQC